MYIQRRNKRTGYTLNPGNFKTLNKEYRTRRAQRDAGPIPYTEDPDDLDDLEELEQSI